VRSLKQNIYQGKKLKQKLYQGKKLKQNIYQGENSSTDLPDSRHQAERTDGEAAPDPEEDGH
jgi:hypothetical protein